MKRKQTHTPRKMSVINSKSSFDVVEAYKATRTNLMFMLGNRDKKCKTVAFTSSFMAEGKSTSCINLAITFAQTGSKVLIIDADMRKPKVNRAFNVANAPGLSDKLSGFADECIYEISKDNLYVMTAGTIPPNPAELLASENMENLIAELEEKFDYVFIDTPPVGLVTDAVIIANRVMGTIIVSRQNITTKDYLRDTVETLERTGTKILGIILNDVNYEKSSYRYSKKYSYKYGYSYGSTNAIKKSETFED